MTDLDELKSALDSPPGFEPVQLDFDRVMAAGTRRRRRQQVGIAAVSGLGVAALLVGGGALMNLAAPSPVANGAAAYAEPSGAVPSDAVPSGAVPSAINSSAPGILGKVVETGRMVEGKQWIIYVETVDPDRLNRNLTLVLGRTKTGYINDFTEDIISYDAGATRMTPGFHAVKPGTVIDGRTTPTFGYYRGNAAKITARDSRTGATVDAHLTAWSGFAATEKAQIFWFDFTQGQTPATLTDLTAYDRSGKKL
jgi:hypothetical protein